MVSLRPHQIRLRNEIRAAIRRGRRRIVAVMPTGAGKTISGADMAANHVAKGGSVIWLTHRDELVKQSYRVLAETGLSVGCIQSGLSGPMVNPHRPVQVCSVQTLVSRGHRPPGTLLIPDEAHHFLADQWVEVLNAYPTALVIGLTATPVRGDGRGLNPPFEELVVGATVTELIEAGVLVPCEVLAPKHPLESQQIAQRPVDAYLAHAKGMRTVCFSGHTKAAEEHLEQFRAAGVRAEFLHYKSTNRERILLDYAAGKIDVLINIAILTEGWDDPPTQCCILARTCGSVGLYIQMVGRILRASPGKTEALLLDLTGTSRRPGFGDPDTDWEFSLDGEPIRKKGEAVQERFCAVCGAVILPPATLCGDCGFVRPGLLAPEVTNDPLVKFARIRRRSPIEKQKHYERMLTEASEQGHHPGRAYHRYSNAYGEQPPWEWKQKWEDANAKRIERDRVDVRKRRDAEADPTLFRK